jgi:DNA damage-inducible protein 1
MVSTQKLSLLIQDLRSEDKFYHIEVEADSTVEDLKCLIAIESGIEPESQRLQYRQQWLTKDTNKLVQHHGIQNNDMLNLLVGGAGTQQRQGGGVSQQDQDLLNSFFTGMNRQQQQQPRMNQSHLFNSMFHNAQNARIRQEVEKIRALWDQDANFKTRIAQQDPEMALALQSSNQQDLWRVVEGRLQAMMKKEREQRERLFRLQNADPNDAEAQKMIEEEIRKSVIESNYQTALENCPEFFGQVNMLYINAEINGKPVKSFVDSGAQSTILSKECAERMGLMHLIDERFAGMAQGVGTSKILGRIHMAELTVIGANNARHKLPCSFTVIESGGVDFLFGLDNLKRH